MKNCLITGGTSGFGLHLSKIFSKKYNLYILAKSKRKFLNLRKQINSKNKLYFLKNNLSNLSQIKKNISKIKSIDLIIFNAATIDEQVKYNVSNIFLVNYLSNFLIFYHLKKKIEKKGKRIILLNISSRTHSFFLFNKISFSKDQLSWIKYKCSKFMMLLFLNKIKRKYKNKTYILNFYPGWMRTNFGNNQKNPLRKILNFIRNIFAKNSLSQQFQAKKLLNICINDFRKYDGCSFDIKKIKKISKKNNDKFLQDKLWNKTVKFLKIKQ